jgi:hypothetical protein
MVKLTGAAGALSAVFVNLVAFTAPNPQPEVNLTLIESLEAAAAFDV